MGSEAPQCRVRSSGRAGAAGAPCPGAVNHSQGTAQPLAHSHCCKSRQGSAIHQHFPEEMSPPDFLDRELNCPAPPNQVLDFSFFKTKQNKSQKPNTLCFTKTTYLSQEIVRDSKGNPPASSMFCTASATKRHRLSSQEVSVQPGTPHHAALLSSGLQLGKSTGNLLQKHARVLLYQGRSMTTFRT